MKKQKLHWNINVKHSKQLSNVQKNIHQIMVNSSVLYHSWDRAWKQTKAEGDGFSIRDDLLNRYSEPHRSYHTLQHLTECIELFSEVGDTSENPAAVELALWFHDAIYDQHGHNEERSAALAGTALAHALPTPLVALVQALIMATRHTSIPYSIDGSILVDIDLAILGANDKRFDEYTAQIRKEYGHIPDAQFAIGRASVLKSFLQRQKIYTTDILYNRLEKSARENLFKAVNGLELKTKS